MGSEIEGVGFSVHVYGGKAQRPKRESFLITGKGKSVGSRKYYKLLIYIYLLLPTYFLLPAATESSLGSRELLGSTISLYFSHLACSLLPRRIPRIILDENDSRLDMYLDTKERR